MEKLQRLGDAGGQQSRGRGLQEPRDCWARTEGWTGWQGAGLRGSGWGVLWGWGGSGFCCRLGGCGVTSRLGYPAGDTRLGGGGGHRADPGTLCRLLRP